MGERTGGNGHGGPTIVGAAMSDAGEIAFRGHGGRRPRALAHGGNGRKHLVQDDRFLYWSDTLDGTITRIPKDGGIPLVLASEQREIRGLAIADGFLYWTRTLDGLVLRMPLGGGGIETIAEGQAHPEAIAVAGDDVIWANGRDPLKETLMKGATRAGPPVKLASRQQLVTRIALDDDWIYWTAHGRKRPEYFTNGAVMKMPRRLPPEGEKKKRIVVARPQTAPEGIAVDDAWIYWASFGSLLQGFGDGAILRRPKRGGKPAVLCGARSAGDVAVDATHVYWIEVFAGALRRVPKEGGAPEALVTSDQSGLLPGGLVVDERFVYWAVMDSRKAGGAVWKMAK